MARKDGHISSDHRAFSERIHQHPNSPTCTGNAVWDRYLSDTLIVLLIRISAAAIAACIANGSDIVRVHDVIEMKQVALVADAIFKQHLPMKKL